MQQYQLIQANQLQEPTTAARTFMTSEHLEDLANSIAERGILQPLLVRQKGERFEIVSGHRRFKAGLMIGLAEFPCIIKDGESDGDNFDKVHENIFREDLNIMDEARFFAHLLDSNGLDIPQVAKKISKSESYVRQRLILLSFNEQIQAALEGKQISFAVAKELQQFDEPADVTTYLDLAIRSGATAAVVSKWRREKIQSIAIANQEVPQEERPKETPEVILYTCPGCKNKFNLDTMISIYFCLPCHQALLDGLNQPIQPQPQA